MRFTLRCPPSEISHTFPAGWEHVLWVGKYSCSGITFAAILPPASCFLLLGSAAHRGVGACEHKSSDTAFSSAKPQISMTLLTPLELHMHKLGPVCFIWGNWSWVSACNFGGRVQWEETLIRGDKNVETWFLRKSLLSSVSTWMALRRGQVFSIYFK